jgi:hypothetical protein
MCGLVLGFDVRSCVLSRVYDNDVLLISGFCIAVETMRGDKIAKLKFMGPRPKIYISHSHTKEFILQAELIFAFFLARSGFSGAI